MGKHTKVDEHYRIVVSANDSSEAEEFFTNNDISFEPIHEVNVGGMMVAVYDVMPNEDTSHEQFKKTLSKADFSYEGIYERVAEYTYEDDNVEEEMKEGGKIKSASFMDFYNSCGAFGGSYFIPKMAKGGGVGKGLSDDTENMFMMLMDESKAGKDDEALNKMEDVAGKLATKNNLLKFKEEAKNIKDKKLRNEILKLVGNIFKGKYKKEYRFTYGGYSYGGGTVSVTSSFFSQFRQGYDYYSHGQ